MEPNLLLVNALEVNRIVQAWDIGSNEIVCSALYGDTYERKLNRVDDSMWTLPHRYSPRAGTTRRVLHVGDSMVYGLGVQGAERFTNLMEQLEPDTEHINAGLPGTAPDSYYAVIHGWTGHPLDLVVMYLFEGNDYAGLDGPSPCCNFEPILMFAGRRALLRCPSPIALDLDNVNLRVLRLISPPPYLLRALIPESHGAALLAAALVGRKIDGTVSASMKAEVDAIIATAAEELRSHGTSLVVVMLPDRSWIEHGGSSDRPDRMLESARRANVRVLDARALFQAAASRGESEFLGSNDCHFNPAGHTLLARWLTEALPRR